MIGNFSSQDFEGETLAGLVKEFQDGIDMELQGLDNYPNDPESYNNNWVAGRSKIASVIKSLLDLYDIPCSEEESKALNRVMTESSPMLLKDEAAIFTCEDGDLAITPISVTRDQNSTDLMRANDELGESQQYINFMCTIKNSSCEYSPHTAIDLTGVLKTANNIDVAPLSSSYECPGYESATAGNY